MSERDLKNEEPAVEHATNDLNWLAQRYVLDELDAGEVAGFEERLGDDDEAAAAVAAAVRLVGAVKASVGDGWSEPSPSGGSEAVRRVRGWLAPAMAAVTAGVALAVIPMAAPKQSLRVPLEPAELVWRWNGFAMDAAVGSGLVADLERPAVERLPQWLVAAVTIAGEAAVAEERN
jgi:anti-sigma factor RsiW